MQIGAFYIRVSTAEQTELSPDAQKRLLLSYAEQNDISIPAAYQYEDEGISGKTGSLSKRCSFQKMIAIAKQKPSPFSVILVYKFSRFARSQEDSIVYKNLLKKQCGVKVISVTEPLIEGPYGELIERIIEWMDEFYSINLANEVRKGMTEKALRGGYQARPPYGYHYLLKKEPPVPDMDQAAIVSLIFEKYVHESLSEREIALYLNKHGIHTKNGGAFSSRTISYLLENPFYIGKVRWNRQYHATHTIRPKKEWIISDGAHQPIVDKTLFEAAQQKRKHTSPPKNHRDCSCKKHWLSGILRCSSCGKTLSYHEGEHYSYFQCSFYSKGQCSISHSISEKKAVQTVLIGLRNIFPASEVRYLSSSKAKLYQQESKFLQQCLKKLVQKEQRIRILYEEGIDDLSLFQKKRDALLKEQTLLSEQAALLEQKKETKEPQAEYTSVIDFLQSSLPDLSAKGKVIETILSAITYDKQKDEMMFYLNLPEHSNAASGYLD